MVISDWKGERRGKAKKVKKMGKKPKQITKQSQRNKQGEIVY
jgi:hypothetical protein